MRRPRVVALEMTKTAAHPFYRRLNEMLNEHGFDALKGLCEKFCATTMARPSLAPDTYSQYPADR